MSPCTCVQECLAWSLLRRRAAWYSQGLQTRSSRALFSPPSAPDGVDGCASLSAPTDIMRLRLPSWQWEKLHAKWRSAPDSYCHHKRSIVPAVSHMRRAYEVQGLLNFHHWTLCRGEADAWVLSNWTEDYGQLPRDADYSECRLLKQASLGRNPYSEKCQVFDPGSVKYSMSQLHL